MNKIDIFYFVLYNLVNLLIARENACHDMLVILSDFSVDLRQVCDNLDSPSGHNNTSVNGKYPIIIHYNAQKIHNMRSDGILHIRKPQTEKADC